MQRCGFVRPKRSLPRQTRLRGRWQKIRDLAEEMPLGREAADKAEVAVKDLGQVAAAMAVAAVDDRAAKVSPVVAAAEVNVDRAVAAAALAAEEGHRVPGVPRLDRGLNGLGLARCTSLRQRRASAPN